MKTRQTVIWIAAVAILSVVSSPGLAGEWQGTETTKDGTVHIMNPADPVAGLADIELVEQWRLGGDTEDEDEFFGVIVAVVADKHGNVYLLDAQLHRVMMYTADGEFIGAIGREGEGPGEFRRPADMVMQPDGNLGIMQRMPGKLIALTTGGEPAENFPFPESADGSARMFLSCFSANNRLIVGVNEFERDDESIRTVFRLVGVTSDGTGVTEYTAIPNRQNMASFKIVEKELGGIIMPWGVGDDGTVYASIAFDGYRVDVWNPDGTPDRVIHREYTSRKRSSAEINRMNERIRVRIDERQPEKVISKTDRDIQKLYPRDGGKLWVLSSRGALDAPDGSIGVFDEFDRNGRFVQQVSLKGEGSIRRDGYFFAGDRLYVVTSLVSARSAMLGGSSEIGEEEAEPISIICYEIGAPQHGML